MTMITNDAVERVSTGVPELNRRVDTFVTWASFFPEPVHDPVSPRTYADEKRAFLSMLPLLYSRHPGEYVAVSGGVIVDHDRSRLEVVRRFFGRSTQAPVYVGFVGARDTVKIPTPIIRRSS